MKLSYYTRVLGDRRQFIARRERRVIIVGRKREDFLAFLLVVLRSSSIFFFILYIKRRKKKKENKTTRRAEIHLFCPENYFSPEKMYIFFPVKISSLTTCTFFGGFARHLRNSRTFACPSQAVRACFTVGI